MAEECVSTTWSRLPKKEREGGRKTPKKKIVSRRNKSTAVDIEYVDRREELWPENKKVKRRFKYSAGTSNSGGESSRGIPGTRIGGEQRISLTGVVTLCSSEFQMPNPPNYISKINFYPTTSSSYGPKRSLEGRESSPISPAGVARRKNGPASMVL